VGRVGVYLRRSQEQSRLETVLLATTQPIAPNAKGVAKRNGIVAEGGLLIDLLVCLEVILTLKQTHNIVLVYLHKAYWQFISLLATIHRYLLLIASFLNIKYLFSIIDNFGLVVDWC